SATNSAAGLVRVLGHAEQPILLAPRRPRRLGRRGAERRRSEAGTAVGGRVARGLGPAPGSSGTPVGWVGCGPGRGGRRPLLGPTVSASAAVPPAGDRPGDGAPGLPARPGPVAPVDCRRPARASFGDAIALAGRPVGPGDDMGLHRVAGEPRAEP